MRRGAYSHDDLLVGLFTAQPAAALDGLCGRDQKALEQGIRVLREVGSRRRPLAAVSEEDLLRWCDAEPETRYRAMADIITVSERTGENTPPHWTSIALRFLSRRVLTRALSLCLHVALHACAGLERLALCNFGIERGTTGPARSISCRCKTLLLG